MTDADFFSAEECKKRNIILQTCPDATTQSVAESTITEILLHSRQRHLAYNDQINKQDVECRNTKDQLIAITQKDLAKKTTVNEKKGADNTSLINNHVVQNSSN